MDDFIAYHVASSEARDIDPANDALRYVCNRFELNIEQRYWLAFLYGCCYSAPTVFYIYNEFPDYEHVNVERLQRWWDNNKQNLIFTTDRLRAKTQNQFVRMFLSYQFMVGNSQAQFFEALCTSDNPQVNYQRVYDYLDETLYYFGRFSLFIYLEMLNVLTGLPIMPDKLDLRHAVSCRNGLAFAMGFDELMNHGRKFNLTAEQNDLLQGAFSQVMKRVPKLGIEHTNIWNVETTLCAYKKYRLGKRYVGFYIDRMHNEIRKMERAVPQGVDWSVLWQFRRETYQNKYLMETNLNSKHILITGECGTGKTWVMLKLLRSNGPWKTFKIGLMVFSVNKQLKLAITGKYTPDIFTGSDLLSMGVMRSIEPFLKHVNKAGYTVIYEGDRFTNQTFIKAAEPFIIRIEGDGEAGRKARGTMQSERHLRAIATRVGNIEPNVILKNSTATYQFINQIIQQNHGTKRKAITN